MVVGREDRGDLKLEGDAKIKAGGKVYVAKNVYSDRSDRTRRDVFAPDAMVDRYGNELPNTVKVQWRGRVYRGKLSFRAGRGGSRIPVYQWYVENKAG